MARLNEPAQPTESIDAVKRRFLRQNRELAKTNSTQSIRIRNLEAEGSRLLAENLSLREQVIQLQSVLENQSNRPSAESINAVKNQLEAKIQELGSLVAELGQIQRPESARRKSQKLATRRPDWGLGEFVDGQDGKLPTIAEGKHYPRKTMNTDELREILEDPENQSPDLGPPPVARFEHENPIKFDPSSTTNEEMPDADAGAMNPSLSVNLETRRKRRDSSNTKINIRRVSVFQSPPDTEEDSANTSNDRGKTIRTGAKRKLSAREEEEFQEMGEMAQADGFRFSRKGASTFSENEAVNDANKDSRVLNALERKVLSNKPVNTDPIVSPKKAKPSANDKSDLKKPISTSKSSSRPRPREHERRVTLDEIIVSPSLVETDEVPLDSLPPETPAPDDIFSPPSNQPSTARPESKDTPPPADLNPSGTSADQSGPAGRAVRRARAPVNYAEPSLISKMRRPTKELVDAVVPVKDERRSMSVKPEDPTAVEKSNLRTVVIKREREDGTDSSWKGLPSAPGPGAQEEVGEKDSPLTKKAGRQRQGSAESGQDDAVDLASVNMTLNSSAAAHAISALMSGSAGPRRKISQQELGSERHKTELKGQERKGNAEKGDQLAIFDFTDSSPTDPPTSSRIQVDLARQSRAGSRRHSSVPAAGILPNVTSGSLPSVSSRQSSGYVRSASTTNLSSSKLGGDGRTKAARELKRSGSTTTLIGSTTAQSNTTDELGGSGTRTGTGNLRGERAARRRRSMML
ncbi:hypothetical protein K432DRAFT_346679 [Lepidopterella palustris CBS 459.81]|uniref:Shugoshin n=1 Tax=Lepidopterella palustris CBS 459.81 TaxID=1314670 RepID=A0A8E2EGZ9_9PEZI|nr:hypothetical protein K432DRAFT_346679 [Lepidopterella palustris CBS 459.81]